MNNRVAARIGLLLTALVWGSTFGLTKIALADVDPVLFLFIRFSVATLSLVPVYLIRRSAAAHDKHLSPSRGLRESAGPGVILGLIYAVGYVAQTVGLRSTSATTSGFITGMNVVFVAVLFSLINRRLPTKPGLAGVLLATAGLLTITVTGRLTLARGDAMTLVCAVFFALHIVATERYAKSVDPVAVTLVQTALISVVTLILCLIRAIPINLRDVSATALLSALYCGVLATSAAFVVQTAAQRVASSIETAIAYSMEPVFAAAFASVFVGEDPSLRVIAGGAMILAGMVTVGLSQSRSSESTGSC
jgi:drug/metabolite transporter (DMT)-like permease